MCAEGFSTLIRDDENSGAITGFACPRNGPKVSHLFFADDSLVFCKAEVEECRKVKDILRWYEEVSGQSINLQKSSISFSPNVTEEKRAVLQK